MERGSNRRVRGDRRARRRCRFPTCRFGRHEPIVRLNTNERSPSDQMRPQGVFAPRPTSSDMAAANIFPVRQRLGQSSGAVGGHVVQSSRTKLADGPPERPQPRQRLAGKRCAAMRSAERDDAADASMRIELCCHVAGVQPSHAVANQCQWNRCETLEIDGKTVGALRHRRAAEGTWKHMPGQVVPTHDRR